MQRIWKVGLLLPWLGACTIPAAPPPETAGANEPPPLEAPPSGADSADATGDTDSTVDPAIVQQALFMSAAEGAGACARSNDSIELVDLGIVALADAMDMSEGQMTKAQRAKAGRMHMRLHQSTECLGKALRLAPDDYVARLALGVTYLMLAKSEYKYDDTRGATAGQWIPGPNWAMYVGAAKQQLGYAYMLRAGQYEPLYYLAEAAVEEGDFAKAREFLKPLQDAGYKRGPVLALQGFMAEWEGQPDQAQQFYQQALQSGWPRTTFSFVLQRLWERQRVLQGGAQ
jgi:hypothetical protein